MGLFKAHGQVFSEIEVPKSFPLIQYAFGGGTIVKPHFQIFDTTLFVSTLTSLVDGPHFLAINARTKVSNDPALFDVYGFPGRVNSNYSNFPVGFYSNIRGKVFYKSFAFARDSVFSYDIFNNSRAAAYGFPSNLNSAAVNLVTPYANVIYYYSDDYFNKFVVDTTYPTGVFPAVIYPKRVLVVENKATNERVIYKLSQNDTAAFASKVRMLDNNDLLISIPEYSYSPTARGARVMRLRFNSNILDTLHEPFSLVSQDPLYDWLENVVEYYDRFYYVSHRMFPSNNISYYDLTRQKAYFDTAGLPPNTHVTSAFVHNDSLFANTSTAWYKKHYTSPRWERISWPAYGGFWSGWFANTVWCNGNQGLRYLEDGVWKSPVNKDPRVSFSITAVADDQIMVHSSGRSYYSSNAGNSFKDVTGNPWAATQNPPSLHPGVILADGGRDVFFNTDSLKTLAPRVSLSGSQSGGEYKAVAVAGQLVSVYNSLLLGNQIMIRSSTDFGLTWVGGITSALPTGPVVRTAAFEDVIYVLIDGRGFYRSADAGVTWSAISSIPARLQTDFVVSGHQQQVLISHGGLGYISYDAGQTFQQLDPAGTFLTTNSLPCRMNAFGIYYTDLRTGLVGHLATPTSVPRLLNTPLNPSPGVSTTIRAIPSGKWLYITDGKRMFRASAASSFTTSLTQEQKAKLIVYPNPVPAGIRELSVPSDGEYHIFTLQGKSIGVYSAVAGRLSLPALQVGVYILQSKEGVIRLVVN